MAEFLVDALQRFCSQAYVDGAGNAVGHWGTGDLAVWLLGHIDTVPGDIEVRLVDGVVHGRGSVDAKGSFAAFVAAVASLPAALGERLTLTLIGATGEEAPGSVGARHAVAQLPRPDLVVIGEPSGWDALTLGYKGTLQVELQTEEPTRHSAVDTPTAAERVVDAYDAVRQLVAQLNAAVPVGANGPQFERLQLRLLDLMTSGDGLTDAAHARLGLRLPVGLDPQELNALVAGVAEPHGVTCLPVPGAVPAHRSGKAGELPAAFRSAIRAVGGTPRHKLKTGTSDMNVVAAAWRAQGLEVPPMVAYGPGDASLDHTPIEHLSIEEYLRSVAVLTQALSALATQGAQS